MIKTAREIVTRRGTIRFPAYIPVTTFGTKYPLDSLIRPYLPRLGPVQAWDVESARECARQYRNAGFDGVAVGGLVPRVRDLGAVLAIIEAVRGEINDLPLHVFGLGKPEVIEALYKAGVDSV